MSTAALAPAKVNLFLQVCGKRADGYHLLDSLVVFAGFGDDVRATLAPSVSLDISGEFSAGLSASEDNLVLKAARLLARKARRTDGVALHLEKRLPIAAGIGGGSSDAAATLRACAKLWKVEIAIPPAELAAELGADVPVCLAGTPSRMQGIGEILKPVPDLPPAWLVLVNPRKPLATGPVFQALAGRHSGPAPEFPTRFESANSLAAFLRETRNDLAVPARELMPDIQGMLEMLASCDGCLLSRLSGSGPTCFGLFAEEAKATAAARQIAQTRSAWWCVSAPMLRAA